ncbi:MAG: FtsX-like permease family protein [Planctomycetota bacterium]
MYKLFLSWRYLRTRWIALASIISVMLGVATMIIVNSVMEGFTKEMHDRLHGILSDVVVESVGLGGIPDPVWHEAKIREVLGDEIAGITHAVRVPAMVNFQVRGQWVTQQIMLIGIDEQTYGQVSDFSKFLKHPENREQLSFLLRENQYELPLAETGWEHRRQRVTAEREFREEWERAQRTQAEAFGTPGRGNQSSDGSSSAAPPTERPDDEAPPAERSPDEMPAEEQPGATSDPFRRAAPAADPFRGAAPAPTEVVFDEAREQHTGIVLGIAITSVRQRKPDGKIQDFFLARPGDDVQITFPTAGQPPKAVSDKFTIVDLYESKMSEYDSSFAFVPLSKLQDLRGMVDPITGTTSVTSIQIRLRAGSNLNVARDRLRAIFPLEQFSYRVETWRDLQGPLLAAVRMETTILNILLFLIIAVAGFGILATFFMIVVEKTRDIGILKALGAPSGGVMSIFLNYGLCLGLVGATVGMILGLIFVANINRIAKGIEFITGHEVFDPTVYYFQTIPTIVKPFTVTWVTLGAILIAVLASVLPALRAARLHPVQALRYE